MPLPGNARCRWPCALASLLAGAIYRVCELCGRSVRDVLPTSSFCMLLLSGAYASVTLGEPWCRLRAPARCLWTCALWSLGAGAAARSSCQVTSKTAKHLGAAASILFPFGFFFNLGFVPCFCRKHQPKGGRVVGRHLLTMNFPSNI